MGCTRCGDCCTYAALEVRPGAISWLQMHGVPVVMDGGVPKVYFQQDCDNYDRETKRCNAYESRPEICREYLCAKARRRNVLTKEVLLERRATLQGNMNAIAGALEQIDWTIAQLDAEDEPEEAEDES